MAEVNEQKEETKAKRGRPRKGPDPEPIVNEEEHVLEMSQKDDGDKQHAEEKVTFAQVQENLHSMYSNLLGSHIGNGGGWLLDIGDNNFNKYNPFLQNQRLKTIASLPGTLSRDDLSKSLEAPQNAEQPLRSQGLSLSSSQYLYYMILRLATDVPECKYYKVPELLKAEDYKNDKFIKEDKYVDEWLTKFDVYNTLKRILLEVKREGKTTYVLRNSVRVDDKNEKHVNYCTFQKMPSDYIKLIGIGEHGYIASFNMMLFMNPAFCLDQYPTFIRDIWIDLTENKYLIKEVGRRGEVTYRPDIDRLRTYKYKYVDEFGHSEDISGVLEVKSTAAMSARSAKNAYMFWVPLPQDVCYTFCSDTSNPWALPDTAGLFLGLQELTDYDTLAGLIQSTPLTALLTAEAETINNPNAGQDQTVLNGETLAGFQDKFNMMTSTNLEAFFAPLKNFKLLSLPNIPNSNEITTKATQNFIMRSGLGGIITTTEKPSVAQVKAAQLIVESQAKFVTKQIESVLNMIINKLIGCEYDWKLIIWGGIFTFSDEVKRDKELFMAGGSFVLPKLLSAYDLTARDARAQELYINSLSIYDDLRTVTQVTQEKLKKIETTGKVGRPEKDESEIDNDNTAASKESGLDTIDMRDFAEHHHESGTCIICGAECDGILCDECREKYDE